MKKKYTDSQITEAVKHSSCILDVLSALGTTRTCGSSHKRMTMRIRKLQLDTSHFKRPTDISSEKTKLKAVDIFVYNRRKGLRERSNVLRRLLIESGELFKCKICDQSDDWKGKKLVLEIDHIDKDPLNNVKDNLRFLCPNCHSQQHN